MVGDARLAYYNCTVVGVVSGYGGVWFDGFVVFGAVVEGFERWVRFRGCLGMVFGFGRWVFRDGDWGFGGVWIGVL